MAEAGGGGCAGGLNGGRNRPAAALGPYHCCSKMSLLVELTFNGIETSL